jgi:hypothetical protein
VSKWFPSAYNVLDRDASFEYFPAEIAISGNACAWLFNSAIDASPPSQGGAGGVALLAARRKGHGRVSTKHDKQNTKHSSIHYAPEFTF